MPLYFRMSKFAFRRETCVLAFCRKTNTVTCFFVDVNFSFEEIVFVLKILYFLFAQNQQIPQQPQDKL